MNFWETFYKNKLMLYGGGLVTLLLIISLLAPWLAPYDPGQIDLTNVLTSPSMKHLCGTDQLGRDVLSRMIWGCKNFIKSWFCGDRSRYYYRSDSRSGIRILWRLG